MSQRDLRRRAQSHARSLTSRRRALVNAQPYVVRPRCGVDMSKTTKDELERQRLDLQLDRELESTFPASDALKITRPRRRPKVTRHPEVEKD
jgi:hypothetical protein